MCQTIDYLIHNILLRIARSEYKKQLRLLEIRVDRMIQSNPHNTFKGTPKQYIKEHRLNKELKQVIINKYLK